MVLGLFSKKKGNNFDTITYKNGDVYEGELKEGKIKVRCMRARQIILHRRHT